jgi:ubiquinone/menaquinone biosynthesis C-methylase UbiE
MAGLVFIEESHKSALFEGLMRAFVKFVAPQTEWAVLDLGCGPGGLARILAASVAHVVGVDTDPNVIEMARQAALADGLANLTFDRGKLAALPYPPGQFDAVLAANLLYQFSSPLHGVHEMVRVTRSGGAVSMLNPSIRLTLEVARSQLEKYVWSDFERGMLVSWASYVDAGKAFTDQHAETLLAQAGLVNVQTATTMDGLFLMAKGSVR